MPYPEKSNLLSKKHQNCGQRFIPGVLELWLRILIVKLIISSVIPLNIFTELNLLSISLLIVPKLDLDINSILSRGEFRDSTKWK